MIKFTESLDYLMHKNHMTRAELAKKIGVGRSTVTTWFNSSCGGVALDTVVKIADLFDVTLDELVYGMKTAEVDGLTSDEMVKLKKLLNHADEILKEG